MFGYVKKKDLEFLENKNRHLADLLQGYVRSHEEIKKELDIEHQRAEYWKAKALYPKNEPSVFGLDKKTAEYIKS